MMTNQPFRYSIFLGIWAKWAPRLFDGHSPIYDRCSAQDSERASPDYDEKFDEEKRPQQTFGMRSTYGSFSLRKHGNTGRYDASPYFHPTLYTASGYERSITDSGKSLYHVPESGAAKGSQPPAVSVHSFIQAQPPPPPPPVPWIPSTSTIPRNSWKHPRMFIPSHSESHATFNPNYNSGKAESMATFNPNQSSWKADSMATFNPNYSGDKAESMATFNQNQSSTTVDPYKSSCDPKQTQSNSTSSKMFSRGKSWMSSFSSTKPSSSSSSSSSSLPSSPENARRESNATIVPKQVLPISKPKIVVTPDHQDSGQTSGPFARNSGVSGKAHLKRPSRLSGTPNISLTSRLPPRP